MLLTVNKSDSIFTSAAAWKVKALSEEKLHPFSVRWMTQHFGSDRERMKTLIEIYDKNHAIAK